MNRFRIAALILMLPALVILSGCGGGGGDSGGDSGGEIIQPVVQEQAAINMSLSGAAETVGSVDVTLDPPQGFIPETDLDGSLAPGSVVTRLPSSYVDGIHSSGGLLRLGVISGAGFTTEEFCTLYKDLSDGEALPSAGEFRVTDLRVTDLNGVEMSGYELILTVERQ